MNAQTPSRYIVQDNGRVVKIRGTGPKGKILVQQSFLGAGNRSHEIRDAWTASEVARLKAAGRLADGAVRVYDLDGQLWRDATPEEEEAGTFGPFPV